MEPWRSRGICTALHGQALALHVLPFVPERGRRNRPYLVPSPVLCLCTVRCPVCFVWGLAAARQSAGAGPPRSPLTTNEPVAVGKYFSNLVSCRRAIIITVERDGTRGDAMMHYGDGERRHRDRSPDQADDQ